MNKLVVGIFSVLPAIAMALQPGDSFQQASRIKNHTNQNILVTDTASSMLQNVSLEPNRQIEMYYDYDTVKTTKAQEFTHTITIHSGVDYSVICKVTSHLYASATGITQSKPTSTNEARCSGKISQDWITSNKIYGFEVVVK